MLHPRGVYLVALFDLIESLRSKQAITLLTLYATFAVGSAAVFAAVVRKLARALEDEFGGMIEDGNTALSQFLESDQFFDLVVGFVRDFDLAAELVQMHPMALFYGWFALTAVPLLVLFTSATAITEEVHTGACRFALVRTGRLSWAVGKLLGQSLMLACGLAIGALGAFTIGSLAMSELSRGSLGLELISLSARAWVLGFAFLGLYLGVSQLTRSVAWARALAVLALFGVSMAGAIIGSEFMADIFPPAAYLAQLFPAAHSPKLWHPSMAERLPAIAALCAFGLVTFGLGHIYFARRDA